MNFSHSWPISNRLLCDKLTIFVSCVEICGFVCSVIWKICDLRIILAWWPVVSLSFQENSKICLQRISQNCKKHLGLGEQSSIHESKRYVPKLLLTLLWELLMLEFVVLQKGWQILSQHQLAISSLFICEFSPITLLCLYSVKRCWMLTLM